MDTEALEFMFTALLFIQFSPWFACYIFIKRASDEVLSIFYILAGLFIWDIQGDPLLKCSDPW